jgi:hypothetical protein
MGCCSKFRVHPGWDEDMQIIMSHWFSQNPVQPWFSYEPLNNPTGPIDAPIVSKQEAYMSKYQPYQEPPNKAASSTTAADPNNEDWLSPAVCDAVEQGKPHSGGIDLSTAGKVKIAQLCISFFKGDS